jgi:APA family basic amino acid/polyamine antiporter
MTAPAQSVSAAPRNGAPKLKRSMGLWMATALVVGNMIGSGVFLLPATLAGTAGPISMLGWPFTGAGAVLLALVFANFGDFIGFQTASGQNTVR